MLSGQSLHIVDTTIHRHLFLPVTLTGTRIWLKIPSFTRGDTLEGPSVIDILSGGLDIRVSENDYNHATGITLNLVNSVGSRDDTENRESRPSLCRNP